MALSGLLCVVGGGRDSWDETAEVYDPHTRTWAMLPTVDWLRQPWGKLLCVVQAHTLVMIYDPERSHWVEMEHCQDSFRFTHSAVGLKGLLYIVGGHEIL